MSSVSQSVHQGSTSRTPRRGCGTKCLCRGTARASRPLRPTCQLAPHPAERGRAAAARALRPELGGAEGAHDGARLRWEAAAHFGGGRGKSIVVFIDSHANVQAKTGAWGPGRGGGAQGGAQALQARQEGLQGVGGPQADGHQDAKGFHGGLEQGRRPGSKKSWPRSRQDYHQHGNTENTAARPRRMPPDNPLGRAPAAVALRSGTMQSHASSSTPIVLIANSEYAVGLAAVLQSIAQHTRPCPRTIVIDTGLTEEDRRRADEVRAKPRCSLPRSAGRPAPRRLQTQTLVSQTPLWSTAVALLRRSLPSSGFISRQTRCAPCKAWLTVQPRRAATLPPLPGLSLPSAGCCHQTCSGLCTWTATCWRRPACSRC